MDEKKSDYRYRQREERRVGGKCEIETLGGERVAGQWQRVEEGKGKGEEGLG